MSKKLVEKLAELKGVSISEYVRSLVLADLGNRSLFTTRLKTEVGAKGQFNESYPTSAVGLHIAKRQLRDRKIWRNHSFAIRTLSNRVCFLEEVRIFYEYLGERLQDFRMDK